MQNKNTISIGNVDLVELDYLVKQFGISRRSAMAYAKTFQLTLIYSKDKRYFSLEALETILRLYTVPGNKSLIMPSSKFKGQTAMHKDEMTTVSKEVVKQASNCIIERVKKWQEEGKKIQAMQKGIKKTMAALQKGDRKALALQQKEFERIANSLL